MIADCDINSEVIRSLGSARFTIWGVYRCLNMQKYPGSVHFLGRFIRNRDQVLNQYQVDVPDEEQISMDNLQFLHFVAQNTPFVSYEIQSAPLSKINDGHNDLIF